MVHLGPRRSQRIRNRPLHQRPSASRTPVRHSLLRNYGVALRANPLHKHRLTDPHCRFGVQFGVFQPAIRHPPYTGTMHPPIRLVAIDMDGTLLPALSQNVSRRNADALRAAQAGRVTVVIATGRRSAYTIPLLESLGLRAGYPSHYVQWCSDQNSGRRTH